MKSDALSLLPQWLSRCGVRHAVLCPGSRSAPLTLTIARSGLFEVFNGVDERSAGFAALGLALGTRRPVVLVCTSGTALLNLGPAVAEAFYLRLPLVVLSADRPAGFEGQQRGQVIRQEGALDHHVRASFRWAPDEPAWDLAASEQLIMKAMSTAVNEYGPVHLNIPLQEPLYDAAHVAPNVISNVALHEEQESAPLQGLHPIIPEQGSRITPNMDPSIPADLEAELLNALQSGNKIWWVAGMNPPNQGLEKALNNIQELQVGWILREDLANITVGVPVRDDWFKVCSQNAPTLEEGIAEQDALEDRTMERPFMEKPQLLISWGGPLVSKHLQLFLRDNPHFKHWRIDPRGDRIDTYNRLDGVWKASPENAMITLHNIVMNFLQRNPSVIHNPSIGIRLSGDVESRSIEKSVMDFDQNMRSRYPHLPFSDSLALSVILPRLQGCRVHLGNSSLVRKFMALPWDKSQLLSIHCNRGTSGIEGTVSTAIGESWAHPQDSVWILNGDLATAYDAGAWLLEPRPPVKMVVLNNGGGDIFRQIPGASVQPECEQHFATPRAIQWSSWCRGYGLPYRLASNLASLQECLNWLSKESGAGFLEIQTSPDLNRKAEKILRTGFDKPT